MKFTLNYSESDLHKSPYKKRVSLNENHLQFRKKFPVSAVKDDEREMKSSWNFHRITVNLIFMIHAYEKSSYLAKMLWERKKYLEKHLKALTRDINHRFFFVVSGFFVLLSFAKWHRKTNVFSYRKVRCRKGQRRPQEITSSSFSSWNSQKDARKKRLEKGAWCVG